MEMLDFRKHCEEKNVKVRRELGIISGKIEYYSKLDNVKLPEGEGLTKLKSRYRVKHGRNIVVRILGGSSTDLRIMLQKEILDSLKRQEKHLLNQDYELYSFLSLEDKDSVISNREVVLSYLDYAKDRNISSKDVLGFLVKVFKSNQDNKSLMAILENNIVGFFKDDNSLNKEDVDTVIFIFRKLFKIIVRDDIDKYKDIIDSVYEEIRNRSKRVSVDSDEKYTLLVRRKAMELLSTYIDGNRIIKVADDMNYFIKLMNAAGLSDNIIDDYTKQMVRMMKQEHEKENDAILSSRLLPDDLKVYNDARKIYDSIDDGEQKELLGRLIKDILSICKYLNLGIMAEELDSTLEILHTKIHLLKEEVSLIVRPLDVGSAYRYVVNEEGVPNIIRNIEAIDVINYGSIYSVLDGLQESVQHEVAFNINGIDFYLVSADETEIIYTVVNGRKVLVGATTLKSVNDIRDSITSSSVEYIGRMLENDKETSNEALEQNYENLLIKLLDLDNTIKRKTMKR